MMTALRRTRAYQTLRHWRHLLGSSRYRASDREARAAFRRFCQQEGGLGLRHDLRPRGCAPKTALIVRNISLPYAKIEAVVMKALQMAGFETIVFGNREYGFLRYDWLAGNRTGFTPWDFGVDGDGQWVDQQLARLAGLQDWLGLEYDGVHVGRFVIASALRALKVGQLDFADPSVQARLRGTLESSVRTARAAARLLEELKPNCAVFLDRGYSGQGEVFDLAIQKGIEVLVWNLGYKSDRLVLKRYHRGNQRDHPLTPSAATWRQLCAMPWSPEYGRRVRDELFQCYDAQDWFSVVGTQFGKAILSRETTRHKVGLSCDKKVAVVFPHILWDGSFFFGEDLFDDYTQWLVETIRAAAANPRLQWVVKLHPAHLVKARQWNDPGKPAEVRAIEAAFGHLPAHVKLVPPDTELSTYSLFEIADYVVTVRGTVGMEAALFGIPVVTAGTGRYDRRGFTLDSSTREEYLAKLATLETAPRLSPEQVERAERYAYGVLFCRPLPLSSVSLDYARDGKATPKLTIHCRTRQEWLDAPDMQQLAGWIAEMTEDMMVWPA